MIITQITPQKRNKDRVNIFLDEKFAFSLNLELLVKYHLTVNKNIDESEINSIIKENEMLYWWDRVLNFLSFRPRTKQEIVNFLNKHETGKQTSDLILDKLITRKLINDVQFIEWFVNQRQTYRPKAQKLLKLELRQKGIDKQLIDEYFDKNPIEKEDDIAWKLIQKKLNLWKNLDSQKKKQKILGFLMQRGFDWGVVNTVLHRLNK